MPSVADIVVSLRAEIADFRRGMDQAVGGINKLHDSAEQTRKVIETLIDVAIIYKMVQLGRAALELGDNIAHAAERAGLGVKSFQELGYAARMTGVDAEQFGRSMNFLEKNIGLVAIGATTNATKGFKQLQIDVHDAHQNIRTLNDLLPEIANRFANIQSSGQKSAIAFELFGRQGAAMIPFLNLGAKGIEELRAKSEKLNQVLSSESVEALHSASQATETLGTALKVYLASAIAEIAPQITTASYRLAELTAKGKETENWAKQTTPHISALGSALWVASNVAEGAQKTWGDLAWVFNTAASAARNLWFGLQILSGASSGEVAGLKLSNLLGTTEGRHVRRPGKGEPEPKLPGEDEPKPAPQVGPDVSSKGAGKKSPVESELESLKRQTEALNIQSAALEANAGKLGANAKVAEAKAKLDQLGVLGTQAAKAAIDALTVAVERHAVAQGVSKTELETAKLQGQLAVLRATPAQYHSIAEQQAILNGLTAAGIPLIDQNKESVQKYISVLRSQFEAEEALKNEGIDKQLANQAAAARDNLRVAQLNLGSTQEEVVARRDLNNVLEIQRVLYEAQLDPLSEEGKRRSDALRTLQQYRDASEDLNRAIEKTRALYEATLTPAEKYAQDLQDIVEAEKASKVSAEEARRAREQALSNLTGTKTATEDLKDAIGKIGTASESAFSRMIEGGAKAKDAMRGLLVDLIKIVEEFAQDQLKRALGDLFNQAKSGGGSGGGGFGFGDILGGIGKFFGGIFGFQSGGSFQVGGHGGPDSKLVSFWATPGEHVTIAPPGKKGFQEGGEFDIEDDYLRHPDASDDYLRQIAGVGRSRRNLRMISPDLLALGHMFGMFNRRSEQPVSEPFGFGASDDYLRQIAGAGRSHRNLGMVSPDLLALGHMSGMFNRPEQPVGVPFGSRKYTYGQVSSALTGLLFADISAPETAMRSLYPASVQKWSSKFGITQEGMAEKIRASLDKASAADVEAGMNFYKEANDWVAGMAERTGLTTRQAAGVTAAMSPQTAWGLGPAETWGKNTNQVLAERVAEWASKPESAGLPKGLAAPKDRIIKALKIARGQVEPEEVLSKVKTGAFFENIISPLGAERATVDIHMGRLMSGLSKTDIQHALEKPDKYKYFEDTIKQVAAEREILPNQAQAIAWFQRKSEYPRELQTLLTETKKAAKAGGFGSVEELQRIYEGTDKPDFVNKFLATVRSGGGGATMSLRGEVPTKGFAYSPFKEAETLIPETVFNETATRKFLLENYERLSKPKNYMGAWRNQFPYTGVGMEYLDVTRVGSEQAAVAGAKKAEQLAIWDIAGGKERLLSDYMRTGGKWSYQGGATGAAAGFFGAASIAEALNDPKVKDQLRIDFGDAFTGSRSETLSLLKPVLAESFGSPGVKDQLQTGFSEGFANSKPQVSSMFGEAFQMGASILKSVLGEKGGGGGGWLDSIDFGGFLDVAGKFLGFQGGGNFEVGGAGGPDSKILAARLTPGELVSVTTKAEQSRLASVAPPTAEEAGSALQRAMREPLGVQKGGGEAFNEKVVAPNVIVNNYTTSNVETRRRSTNGGRDLEIIVSEIVARDFHQNGPAARAMQQTHGMQRSAVGR